MYECTHFSLDVKYKYKVNTFECDNCDNTRRNVSTTKVTTLWQRWWHEHQKRKTTIFNGCNSFPFSRINTVSNYLLMLLVHVPDVKSCWRLPLLSMSRNFRTSAMVLTDAFKTWGRGSEQKPRSTFTLTALLQQWPLTAGTWEFSSQSLGQSKGWI